MSWLTGDGRWCCSTNPQRLWHKNSKLEPRPSKKSVEAGKTNVKLNNEAKGCGLADSIIVCTAKSVKGKVVTGDEHFRDMAEAIFIKE